MENQMQIKIDWAMFFQAFGRDLYCEAYDVTTYLDLETGGDLWVYGSDDDASMEGFDRYENKKNRLKTNSYPDKYLPIPGRSHSECHGILIEFLNSEWTDDVADREFASACYFGSIGGWKRKIEEADRSEIINKYGSSQS
jgi:hypothetical protein